MILLGNRRSTDGVLSNPPPMRLLHTLFAVAIIITIACGVTGVNSWATSVRHAAELQRQQQISDANANALTRVCTVLTARDAKLQKISVEEAVVYSDYAKLLPGDFSARMSTILTERSKELAAIDANGCATVDATTAAAATSH